MNEQEKNILRQALTIADTTENEFFHFHVNTKEQLLLGEFQLFQSLATISLAFIAIALGTKSFAPTIWWFLTTFFSMILLIFVTTFIRETIDAEANGLEETEAVLKTKKDEIASKVQESFENDDFSIYENHLMATREPLGTPLQSYAGEVAVFLFLNTLVFGFLAILDSSLDLSLIPIVCIAFVCLTFSSVVSFSDWNLKLISRISRAITILLKSKKS